MFYVICNFCSPITINRWTGVVSNLLNKEFMEIFSGLQREWNQWGIECTARNLSVGLLQVSVGGGRGNASISFPTLGPFRSPWTRKLNLGLTYLIWFPTMVNNDHGVVQPRPHRKAWVHKNNINPFAGNVAFLHRVRLNWMGGGAILHQLR